MPHFASRMGSGAVALLVTTGLALSSTPVEAASPRASGQTVLRCTTRHHVRHCVRGAVHPAKRIVNDRKPIGPKPQPAPTMVTATTTAGSRGLAAQELALVNADRKAAGLPTLAESAVLDRIATARSQDMVTNGYLGHYRPGDRTLAMLELLRAERRPLQLVRREHHLGIGAAGGVNRQSLQHLVDELPGEHRANILNTRYRHIGIGVVVSGSRVYMVEDFTN